MITSSSNKTIISDSLLKDKKERDKRNEFLLEGAKLIEEASKCGYDIERVYALSEEKLSFLPKEKIELVTENVIAKLSDVKTPQGEIAVVKKCDKKRADRGRRAIVLENLQDPKNVGALIRTAAATDFIEVITINCADPYSMKAIRSSMGGIFRVNIMNTTIDKLKDTLKGKKLFVADMNGENIFEKQLPHENIAISVGNEGNGVSDTIKALADEVISIPMCNGVESLNVAVSGSIVMYQFQKENK